MAYRSQGKFLLWKKHTECGKANAIITQSPIYQKVVGIKLLTIKSWGLLLGVIGFILLMLHMLHCAATKASNGS